MEDFYSNETLICDNSNTSDCYGHYDNISDWYGPYGNTDDNFETALFSRYVMTCIILCMGLPLTLVAIRAVYSLVRNDQVAPIYLINLLISDVLQFSYMIIEVTQTENIIITAIFMFIYLFGLMSSVGFMVCIAMERYLLIAWPLWYRCRRTIKFSVLVCVGVWALSFFPMVLLFFIDSKICYAVMFLLPFPLLIFFLAGTIKALSAAISVPSDEKRRIVAVLVTVLLIYMLLFLPIIIHYLKKGYDTTLASLAFTFLRLSPLADLVLYVFLRKGTADKLLACLCCCRMDSDDTNRQNV